jgi:gas vesicle protein GvpN
VTTVLRASPRRFVSTPAIERIVTRAYRYLQSGFSVHLRGPAGTGKTTLAMHLADLLARPMMLLYGDDDYKTADLIGNQTGYTRKKVVDNYIHSVVKVEDELRHNWIDSRLTLACREGFTLIYDEFNRSRPEVNNVLLSVLEEKLLVLPPNSNRNEYIRVNPQFRTILTSNPEEYCGVHATQDALLDRLVTINIPEPDELTQQEIVIHKTGIDRESASIVVQTVKTFRQRAKAEKSSGLRSCLILAKICHEHDIVAMPENPEFRDMCQDVLLSRSNLPLEEATQLLWEVFNTLIMAHAMQQETEDFAPRVRVLQAVATAAPSVASTDLEPVDDSALLSQWLAEEDEAAGPELTAPQVVAPEAPEHELPELAVAQPEILQAEMTLPEATQAEAPQSEELPLETLEPALAESVLVQPALVQPATVQSATIQPATVQPLAVQPMTVQPALQPESPALVASQPELQQTQG